VNNRKLQYYSLYGNKRYRYAAATKPLYNHHITALWYGEAMMFAICYDIKFDADTDLLWG